MLRKGYRLLQLPRFPVEGEENGVRSPFSAEALLGGFLIARENRMAELAARFAADGVPVFDRPLGGVRLDAVAAFAKEPSRADVETLLSAVRDPDENLAELFRNSPGLHPLYAPDLYNSARRSPLAPAIVGYAALEDVGFLSPLVFFGPSGVGKTRLVEGICQTRRARDPRKTIYYLSASEFSRALLDAIRREQTQLFRQLFRQARVFALENIDELQDKETTQLEFLPLLDDALKSGKLVIVTSPRHPDELDGLVPDLRARLSSGLAVPVALPSEETKRDVVEEVARRLNFRLSETSLDLFARRLPSPIEALCASVVQAAREFAATGRAPEGDAAEDYVERRSPERTWTASEIIHATARRLGISVVEMRSRKQNRNLVLGRMCAVWLIRKLVGTPFRELGREFSNRDHATMLHAEAEAEARLRDDPDFRVVLRDVTQALGAEGVVPELQKKRAPSLDSERRDSDESDE